MKISAKVDYACRALLELALHWPRQDPLRIQDIARKQRIPVKFLVQILLNLKQINMVQSIRGKEGGYLLTKAPKEINLWDIYVNFSDHGIDTRAISSGHVYDVIDNCWYGLHDKMKEWMRQITFEDMTLKYRTTEKILTFTI